MNNVHGIQVAGATFPATIWHDFMSVAHGTDCNSFPQPTQPAKFSTFYGDHAANSPRYSRFGGYGGRYGGRYGNGNGYGTGTPGTGGTGGNGGTGGYNPNLYATPPQGAPQTVPPPQSPNNTGGGTGAPNGGGGGGGGGNGAPHP
jgi:hypothetical protein